MKPEELLSAGTGTVLAMMIATMAAAEPARHRLPAPAEDEQTTVAEAVFGEAAGHGNADRNLHVMEWVAKRVWYILGLPWERRDEIGPPDLRGLAFTSQGVVISGTVAVGGVPLRNQIVTCRIEQRDRPVLLLLRSTDAFGELLIEADLKEGTARARSVTVSRSMIGGQSHSSPMPEQSDHRVIAEARFTPAGGGWHRLRMEARGGDIQIDLDDRTILEFEDPDPAGGKFGFGCAGTMTAADIQQWELISPTEKQRREACLRDMRTFVRELDAEFPIDVARRNRLAAADGRIHWSWPATGATTAFHIGEDGTVHAVVTAGLHGNDTLIQGHFPDVAVIAADGSVYKRDPDRGPVLTGDTQGIRMTLPLKNPGGKTADARIAIRFTVQTVWFWTVGVEGVEPAHIQAFLGVAPPFAPPIGGAGLSPAAPGMADSPVPAASWFGRNPRAGIYIKGLEPGQVLIGRKAGDGRRVMISTPGARLRFATVILPAQPLNRIGFGRRMVHYIKYPEGPVQHWRRMPSFQNYPDNVDLARFAGHGTDAMVWHHTWLSCDFRDREAFLVNVPEMRRAMKEAHRLGMTVIGYLGIVPGRSSLLGIEDTASFGHGPGTVTYEKNWDLQDFTFYHVAGRWQEFLPWMTDYWCREYGLDGYYIDGRLAVLSGGVRGTALRPEDAELSWDEMLHRLYYRVRKVLERYRAGFGLEAWGGSDPMLFGFYDGQMIGEAFQEAPPEDYRDLYNVLLAGTTYKMYGMRASSQNPYNIAMAAVCLSDIQVCSGNGAWGDDPDTAETWKRIRPYWDVIRTVDWDRLLEARPWYAQELVRGEGFYAAHYTEPTRVLIFLANRTERPGIFDVFIDPARLPRIEGTWTGRYVLGRSGEIGPLGDGSLSIGLPALHDGPVGLELRSGP